MSKNTQELALAVANMRGFLRVVGDRRLQLGETDEGLEGPDDELVLLKGAGYVEGTNELIRKVIGEGIKVGADGIVCALALMNLLQSGCVPQPIYSNAVRTARITAKQYMEEPS